MQGKRTRALDSRGRPVPGLYRRDSHFIAGFMRDGRWTMQTLDAETLTEARRERDGLLAGLHEAVSRYLRRRRSPRCSPSTSRRGISRSGRERTSATFLGATWERSRAGARRT